ncbi:hypothetical protein MRX96_045372 [Rhipicephalus microplus]
MSSLVLFKIVLFKGPSDKSNTTVSTFTSLRVPPASTTRVTRASPEPPSLPTSPEHRHALPHHHTSKNDCDAPSCRAVAQWLRSELDFNIDPCDHFYKYVCNKYRGGWNVFSDLSLSEEESKSLRWRFKQPESSNLRHYERYLSLFGANPKQDKELALKLFGYERALVTPRMAYLSKRMASRIRSAFENALQASSYLTADIRAHLINKLLNHTIFIGSPGRRLDPEFVEDIYKLLPDAPLDWLFPTWIKARGLEYQYYWRDTTSTLYEEDEPNSQSYVTAPRHNQRSMLRRKQLSLIGIDDQLVDSIDTENLCDLEGTKFAYAAFASLPQKYRDVKLVGLNMTSEQLYFVSHCLTMCSSPSTSKRTALLTQSRYAPAWKRCMVPLRNMPEFSRAFGCAKGTVMNPTEKCSIW